MFVAMVVPVCGQSLPNRFPFPNESGLVATYNIDGKPILEQQAEDATSGHAQGTVRLTKQQQHAIVEFEMKLETAQAYDYGAGALDARGSIERFQIGFTEEEKRDLLAFLKTL